MCGQRPQHVTYSAFRTRDKAEATVCDVHSTYSKQQGRGHHKWRTRHQESVARQRPQHATCGRETWQRPPYVTYTTSRISSKAEANKCDVRFTANQ
jgi:hypothetical protein